jgi:hypothetical protein
MKQTTGTAMEPKTKALMTILIAGFVSGLLDSIAASVVFYLKLGMMPGQVMQFVASAIFGQSAFAGGTTMILLGTLIHFLIAVAISAIYFYCYPKIELLGTYPVLSGFSFGLGVWLFLNLAVIPFTKIPPSPVELGAVIVGIVWHMVLVGLPISLIVRRHYFNNPLY